MTQSRPLPAQGNNTYHGISVIVITHNEETNIRDCLVSLTKLDYPQDKFEILVVDSSTDSTPDIVREYKGVKLMKSEKGFSQQKNVGLKAAAFEICAYTDADCIIPADWLKVINRVFQEEEVSAIGGNAYPPRQTKRFGLWAACVGHPAGGAVGFDGNVTRSIQGVRFIAGCNGAYRKKALLDVGEFDPSFYDGGEDVDISLRLRNKGYFIDYIPELTVFHKPRTRLSSYMRWNIRVGVTKYNLKRPSLIKLVLQPSFPLWPLLLVLVLIYLVKFPYLLILTLVIGWLFYLGSLYVMAKPYPLLIKRRKKIGVNLFAVLTVIPVLIFIRQVCINLGQLKKWHQTRNPYSGPRNPL